MMEAHLQAHEEHWCNHPNTRSGSQSPLADLHYRLHAVGFTESGLPIPYSSYPLTESSLKFTSCVAHKSRAKLKAVV
jgi:hypothetical protein